MGLFIITTRVLFRCFLNCHSEKDSKIPEMVKCSPEEFPNFGKSSDEVESSLNRIELNSFARFILFDSKISNNSPQNKNYFSFKNYFYNLFILNRFWFNANGSITILYRRYKFPDRLLTRDQYFKTRKNYMFMLYARLLTFEWRSMMTLDVFQGC